MGLHQGTGFPGHDHSEGIRRPGLLRPCAFGDRHQAVDALVGAGGVGHGAQLAGAGRTVAALRHRGAEAPLPAAPGPRRGNTGLRAHQPVGRLGRGRHSRPRHGLQGPVARPGSPGHARHLGQALHHAGARLHAAGAGVSPVRPGRPAGRAQGSRHHLRTGAARSSRRRHRPAPFSAQRDVHERPHPRHGRIHAAGVHHRRARHGRPGLAHADGMPGGGPLDLAAVVQRRHGPADRARRGRLCAGAQPVPHAGGQIRRRGGGAGAHRRPHLPDGRGARHDGRRRGPGRKARRGIGHRQIPRHRTRPPGGQRRHGHQRRQGHLPGSVELPGPRLPATADRHHGGRRQHSHAQPDHLRPGRDPLPSLRAGRNARGAGPRRRARPARVRPRAVGPCPPRGRQRAAGAGRRAERRAAEPRPARGGAFDARLLSRAVALQQRLRAAGRRLHAGAGRQPEAARAAVGAAGRHPGADVPGQRGAQAFRGRRPPGRGRAPGALGRARRAVPAAAGLRRRAGQSAQPVGGLDDATYHLPMGTSPGRAGRQAGPGGGAVADRPRRGARPPDRQLLHPRQ